MLIYLSKVSYYEIYSKIKLNIVKCLFIVKINKELKLIIQQIDTE